jgi:hypothetical protein
MPALEDYLYFMEVAPSDVVSAAALIVAGFDASATGTCGVTTPEAGLALSVPILDAELSWLPIGDCPLPSLRGVATTAAWRPAWGEPAFPAFGVTGQISFPLDLDLVLPAFFYLAAVGGVGAALLPLPEVLAVSERIRMGTAVGRLPAMEAVSYACGLDSPVINGAGSDAVVGLLCQGGPQLSLAAAALGDGAEGDDAVAASLLAGVARSLTYVSDGDAVDVWTCAAGTYFRGTGDCEDGAILLHALLLAAGLPTDRLVTAFGRVGIDREGHAWVAYRRRSDNRWAVLDWTEGEDQGVIAGLPVLDEAGYNAVVDYALTAQAFFTVRLDADVFFIRSLAEGFILPGLAVESEASLGGQAALHLGSESWICRGQVGASARIGLILPVVSGAAGSAAAGMAFGAPTAWAVSGSCGAMMVPRSGVSGRGGGGGLSVLTLDRPALVASARVALVATAGLHLARIRGAGTGLVGISGQANGRLPRLRLRTRVLPGNPASGRQVLDLVLVGSSGPVLSGQGEVSPTAWTTVGEARPDGARLAAYSWELVDGKEWL